MQGNLVSLNLNSVGLSGNIPSCLYSQGSSLISIDLGMLLYHMFKISPVSRAEQSLRLTYCLPHAGSNNFTGTLQNTIPTNSSLQLLHVDYNQLTGGLPASLANAKYLADLDTTMNKMSGTIPPGIGNITTLRSFVVKMNNHSGEHLALLLCSSKSEQQVCTKSLPSSFILYYWQTTFSPISSPAFLSILAVSLSKHTVLRHLQHAFNHEKHGMVCIWPRLLRCSLRSSTLVYLT